MVRANPDPEYLKSFLDELCCEVEGQARVTLIGKLIRVHQAEFGKVVVHG
jgi:hypothetical protein